MENKLILIPDSQKIKLDFTNSQPSSCLYRKKLAKKLHKNY
jgi:hypothetical protein